MNVEEAGLGKIVLVTLALLIVFPLILVLRLIDKDFDKQVSAFAKRILARVDVIKIDLESKIEKAKQEDK